MRYQDYERALSAARLNKYLIASEGDKNKALILYRHNVKLCQKFYGILNVFEIVLRNAINSHYINQLGDPNWIKNQLGPEGILENHPHKQNIQKTIADLNRVGKYTNDRVVSSVTFGFWTHLFTKNPFLRGGQSLLQIFPNRTKGLGQRAIHNELHTIKNFRNKIAHHEAICFDTNGLKNAAPAKTNYNLILKYINFLGYSENHLFYGLDIQPDKVLDSIDQM